MSLCNDEDISLVHAHVVTLATKICHRLTGSILQGGLHKDERLPTEDLFHQTIINVTIIMLQ